LYEELSKFVLLKKTARLTDADQHQVQATFLSRVYTRSEGVIHKKLSPKFINELATILHLENANPVENPGMTSVSSAALKPEDSLELGKDDHRLYREALGVLNYVAADRPESQWVIKELSRQVQAPLAIHMKQLRHLCRFLMGTRELTQVINTPTKLDIVLRTDANWPPPSEEGGAQTRKSTDCIHVILGGNLVHSSSKTQSVLALSSAESELGGIQRGACAAVFLSTFMNEVRLPAGVPELGTDSAAGIGMASRLGPARVKHIQMKQLFVQQLINAKRVALRKIPGKDNSSDIGTKVLPTRELLSYVKNLGYMIPDTKEENYISTVGVKAKRRTGALGLLTLTMLVGGAKAAEDGMEIGGDDNGG
jgi:hypothetical protein